MAGVGNDAAQALAAQALQDPQVQAAAKEEAQKQGQAMSKTYCESLVRYGEVIKKKPNILPLGDLLRCSQENVASYEKQFATWNIIFTQMSIVLFPVYLVFFIIGAVSGLDILALFTGLLSAFIYAVSILFFSQMSYYYVVEKGGCCGDCGYALWILIYALLIISSIGVSVGTGEVALALTTWMRRIYWITVIPGFYIVFTAWKLGGGRALYSCCTKCYEATRDVTRNGGARDVEAGQGRAPVVQASPPPSNNPANRLE